LTMIDVSDRVDVTHQCSESEDSIEEVPLPLRHVDLLDISSESELGEQSDHSDIDLDNIEELMFRQKPKQPATLLPEPSKSAMAPDPTPTPTSSATLSVKRQRFRTKGAEPRSDVVEDGELEKLLTKAAKVTIIPPGSNLPKKEKQKKKRKQDKKSAPKSKQKAKGSSAKSKAKQKIKKKKIKHIITEVDVKECTTDVSTLNTDEVMELIKKYTPGDVDFKIVKKKFHSKVWHAERNRNVANGVPDQAAKDKASTQACLASERWMSYHVHGDDIS
jgi:hypothetical protein